VATARITIEQNGVRGAASKSRDDLVTGAPVKLRNFNDDGVVAWRWKLTLPKGSSAALTNVVAASPEFTPDVPGTYVIELSVNEGGGGLEDSRLAAVRLTPITTTLFGDIEPRYLGVGEDTEANWTADFGGSVGLKTNDTGWWEDLDRWLRILADIAVNGAGGSGTEPILDPSITETLGAIDLTASKGFAAGFFDPGFPAGPLALLLPPVVLPDDVLGGRRVGLVIPNGNPGRDISVVPSGSDAVADFLSFALPTPGAPVLIPTATFSGYSVLVYEAVPGLVPGPPATITAVTPDTDPGPFPLGAPVPITIDGTGGTLPALLDLDVSLVPNPGPGIPTSLTLFTATQGAPGGAWQITGEIPAGSLAPGSYDVVVNDLSSFSVYAQTDLGFGAGVPATPAPVGDVNGWIPVGLSGGGGGGSDWASVLAAGNESGGTDAVLTDEDQIEWDAPSGGGGELVRGRKSARRQALPGFSSGATNIGSAVALGFPSVPSDVLDTQNMLILRIQAIRRTQVALNNITQEYAVIERVYTPTAAGGLNIARTITYENPNDWLSVVNTGGDIFLQADDGAAPAEVYAVVEVVAAPGRNFA